MLSVVLWMYNYELPLSGLFGPYSRLFQQGIAMYTLTEIDMGK